MWRPYGPDGRGPVDHVDAEGPSVVPPTVGVSLDETTTLDTVAIVAEVLTGAPLSVDTATPAPQAQVQASCQHIFKPHRHLTVNSIENLGLQVADIVGQASAAPLSQKPTQFPGQGTVATAQMFLV